MFGVLMISYPSNAADTSWVTGTPQTYTGSDLSSLINQDACPVPSNPADSRNIHAWGFGPNTAILQNGCWGGVVYQYWWKGHEFENSNSPGASINVDFNQYQVYDPIFALQSPFSNPTQAGDINNHGGHLLAWGYFGDYPNYSGMWTTSNPLDYLNLSVDVYAGLDPAKAVVYPNLTFTTAVVPRFAETENVTAFETVVQSNEPSLYALIQVPAVYLKANFDTLYTFDVIKQQLPPIATPSPACTAQGNALGSMTDANMYHWYGGTGTAANVANTFKSTCGVAIATDTHADFDQGYTFGVYGCTPDLGGSITKFDTLNGSCDWHDSSPTSWNAVTIYPEYFTEEAYGSPLPQGSKTFLTYFITGASVKEVTDQALHLYSVGVR